MGRLSLGRLLCVTAAGAVLLGVAAPASADPLADARRRAEVLRGQVADLQRRTDAAVEQYDGAQDALAGAVNARFAADAALAQARRADAAAADVRIARVRSLYELGGPAVLYGTLLQARSPTEALSGVRVAQRLLGLDAHTAAAEGRTSQRLVAAAHTAAEAATSQVQQARRVAALVGQVQGLLAQQQSVLAGADADVVRLAQQQAQERERQAEAAFAARLSAAQAAAVAAPAFGGLQLGPSLPPSARTAAVLAAARAQLGKPYVWGATGPDAFDCSGLTGFAYAAGGVRLPRTASQQWGVGPHPSLAELQPGDLLFWATDPADPSTIDHVGLYIGDGSMIVAPHTGTDVQVQQVYGDGFVGATRVPS